MWHKSQLAERKRFIMHLTDYKCILLIASYSLGKSIYFLSITGKISIYIPPTKLTDLEILLVELSVALLTILLILYTSTDSH